MTRRRKDPLRDLTGDERRHLTRLRRSSAAPAVHVARAVMLLAVADGSDYQAAARDRSAVGGGSGSSAGMAVNSRSAHGRRTALGTDVAPSSRTRPSAGRNKVRTLAVPARTYSCGWRAGCPSGCHDGPGCGTAWKGPASSSHQTARPRDAPDV